ncbi:MAG TPA: FHA domain-containing protein [Capillimicrobium sp.]|jgi:pSer/pThr/pTyr-binding forkhead associated (FHA) protein
MTDDPQHTQILSSRELERAALSVPVPAPGRYLAVRSGDEMTLLALRPGAVTRIGRGLSCDVHLDDASVSRRHARIVERGGRPALLDDRSMNGTYVNGARVEAAILTDGDEIVLGRVQLRFVEVAGERAQRATG